MSLCESGHSVNKVNVTSDTQRTEGHTKQDFSILEFKNQVSNSLHKLLVLIGELILILGSKVHSFLVIFCRIAKISLKIQPEIQKLGFLKVKSQNYKKMLVSGP